MIFYSAKNEFCAVSVSVCAINKKGKQILIIRFSGNYNGVYFCKLYGADKFDAVLQYADLMYRGYICAADLDKVLKEVKTA